MYDVATPSPFRLFSFLDFTCLFYTCLVPCATCPLAPLSELLPLAVALWGSFACPFVVLPPSWSPFVSRAFLALCLVFVSVSWLLLCLAPLFRLSLFVFLPVVLRLSSLRPLCASSVVAGFPVLLFLLCCEVAPPRWLLSPSPPSVVPLRRPGPVSVLVPPSGYLVASCDGPVALP